MWTSCASLLRHLATPLLRLTDRGQADMTTLLNSSCNFSYGRNINCVIAVVTTTALLRSAGGQTCRLQLQLRDFRKDSTTRIAAGSKNRWHKAKLKREHKYDVCVLSVSHTLCSYTHTQTACTAWVVRIVFTRRDMLQAEVSIFSVRSACRDVTTRHCDASRTCDTRPAYLRALRAMKP